MTTKATAPSSTSGGAPLSWGDGLALTARRDVLAHEAEPSRAPNHVSSRHDDGAVTAELHEVDLLLAGTEQNEVRDPEVEHQRPPHHGCYESPKRAEMISTARAASSASTYRSAP